jgi:hypothetical protein
MVRTVPVADFFAPENIGRIVGAGAESSVDREALAA